VSERLVAIHRLLTQFSPPRPHLALQACARVCRLPVVGDTCLEDAVAMQSVERCLTSVSLFDPETWTVPDRWCAPPLPLAFGCLLCPVVPVCFSLRRALWSASMYSGVVVCPYLRVPPGLWCARTVVWACCVVVLSCCVVAASCVRCACIHALIPWVGVCPGLGQVSCGGCPFPPRPYTRTPMPAPCLCRSQRTPSLHFMCGTTRSLTLRVCLVGWLIDAVSPPAAPLLACVRGCVQ
jgi:hypothetical protein